MRYVLTNAQMREADKFTIETLEVPSLLLMERAGAALAEEAERLCPEGGILCVCGGGNNGGDGFVAPEFLCKRGFPSRRCAWRISFPRIVKRTGTNLKSWAARCIPSSRESVSPSSSIACSERAFRES